MGCVVSKPVTGPGDLRGLSISEMNPSQLQQWLAQECLTSQSAALVGMDGATLLSATDEELAQVEGLGSPLMRRSLRNSITSHETKLGGHSRTSSSALTPVLGTPAPGNSSGKMHVGDAGGPAKRTLEDRAEAAATSALERQEELQEKLDAKKEHLEVHLGYAKEAGKLVDPLLPQQVRDTAVNALDQAESVQALVEGAAEAALSAAEELPLVGGVCKILHRMYRAVKRARDNKQACNKFGETLRTLETVLLKAAKLNNKSESLESLKAALEEAAVRRCRLTTTTTGC